MYCPGQWVRSDPPSSVAMTEKSWRWEQRALIRYYLTIHRSCDRDNFTNDMNESQKWQKTLLGRMFRILLKFLVSAWLRLSVFYWFCKLRLMLNSTSLKWSVPCIFLCFYPRPALEMWNSLSLQKCLPKVWETALLSGSL